jgi:hypothetical protein
MVISPSRMQDCGSSGRLLSKRSTIEYDVDAEGVVDSRGSVTMDVITARECRTVGGTLQISCFVAGDVFAERDGVGECHIRCGLYMVEGGCPTGERLSSDCGKSRGAAEALIAGSAHLVDARSGVFTRHGRNLLRLELELDDATFCSRVGMHVEHFTCVLCISYEFRGCVEGRLICMASAEEVSRAGEVGYYCSLCGGACGMRWLLE